MVVLDRPLVIAAAAAALERFCCCCCCWDIAAAAAAPAMFDLGGEDRSITSIAAREVITLLYLVLSTLDLLATGLDRKVEEEEGLGKEAGLGIMAPYAAATAAILGSLSNFPRKSSPGSSLLPLFLVALPAAELTGINAGGGCRAWTPFGEARVGDATGTAVIETGCLG